LDIVDIIELLDCFETLAKDSKFPVRRTLACSLHEIAHVLRTSLTERHVLPVMDAFLKDLDEVRFGVIKNLSRIIKVVSPAKRAEYIKTLWEIQASENWRWRQHLARQMGRLAMLYTPELTVSAIVPLFFHLCRDRVAAVRNVAASAIGYLLHRLSVIRPTAVKDVITQIMAFFTAKVYHERQLFIRMCQGMLGVVDQVCRCILE
jgi:serine/threonine-protein phosphatase 4 regulatory subunit 1